MELKHYSTAITALLSVLLIAVSANAIDDESKNANIGNISLHVTNYGLIGDGFNIEDVPSGEYPKDSGIEHIFDGALWIGALKGGERYVTTGAHDVSSLNYASENFEFTTYDEDVNGNGDLDPGEDHNGNGVLDIYRILERSSLPTSQYYDPNAVSHQDLICDFADTNTIIPQSGEEIPNHRPIGLTIHMEAYAWSTSFADAFVILQYDITNVWDDTLTDVYVGMFADLMVGNTNFTPTSGPNRSWNYRDDGDGWIDSLLMNYEWDYDGDFGNAESYGGIKFLGCTPSFYEPTFGDTIFYNDSASVNFWFWQFRNNNDPVFFSPITDGQKYEKMSTGLNHVNGWRDLPFAQGGNNRITLVSVGPFPQILPDSSIQAVFAFVCGSKYGDDPVELDTDRSKTELMRNARWAQVAYNGEDTNGNGILDPGEDGNGNGMIDRYNLPAAPPAPRLRMVPDANQVTLYWDDSPETAIDPVSNEMDFEGYRIYRARISNKAGAPSFKESFKLLSEYDKIDDFAFNIGLEQITMAEPDTVNGIVYKYKYVSDRLLDGWQYAFAVTSFDTGDPVNDLQSLESSVLENAQRIIPGPSAQSSANRKVTVFPNPYKVSAIWDGRKSSGIKERERMVHFANLPEKCQIRIYSLAGELVRKIEHDGAVYDGSDISWYDQYAGDSAHFPGGIHSWDLVTDHDQAVATGLYIYTVEDYASGDIQKGKMLIIK
ncbi:MAG: hypothetical protein GF307_12850 [candidate division Zixibacteria bacterium]|nr:hypothetical protein [candidate division Zixibacteria bacterium]